MADTLKILVQHILFFLQTHCNLQWPMFPLLFLAFSFCPTFFTFLCFSLMFHGIYLKYLGVLKNMNLHCTSWSGFWCFWFYFFCCGQVWYLLKSETWLNFLMRPWDWAVSLYKYCGFATNEAGGFKMVLLIIKYGLF